ncbi:hypothetical protein Ancab_040380 [Ancistrocladus abbreviatus]
MSATSLELAVAFAFLLICSSLVSEILAEPDTGIRCIEGERQALVQFKQGLVDDYGLLTSWGNHGDDHHNRDCCQWKGVQCSNITGHVISLNLRGNYLGGNVSSSLLALEHLNYLDLSGNDFESSQFLGFIGSLVKLSYVNLSYCGISGAVPRQFQNLSNLKHLDLSFNFLHSKNLAWVSTLSSLKTFQLIAVNLSEATDWLHAISSLPHLTYLDLTGCSLPDPAPPSGFNISNSLAYIHLGYNSLPASSIYTWLFNISHNLTEVGLLYNNLQGLIPEAFGNMASLSYLDLSVNQLQGPIPKAFGKMSSLSHLDLSVNQLQGPIPKAFGKMSSLSHLDLSGNQLQGPIPEALGNKSSLHYISLSYNHLQGPIPKALTMMSSLYHLDLSSNKLQGRIPKAFGNMSSLSYLDLSFNILEGPIPEVLGSLSSLSDLNLSGNQLQGSIPETLGSLSFLSDLDLSHNQLKGLIPEALGNLSSLFSLSLSHNQIGGGIPNSFGHLCSLDELDLSANNLTGDPLLSLSGCIEKSLRIVDLSHNSLFGSLHDLKRFRALFSLDLSHNQLNESLPSFDANQTSSLHHFYLGYNQITGSMPKELGLFSNLEELSMPSNFLNGTISEVHLSQLANLTYLDLSFNKLAFNINPHWIPPPSLQSILLDSCRLGPPFPNWLGALEYVGALSVSDAGISDKLPKWFWGIFAAKASVNLSHNQIHGALSESVAPFTQLAEVDLSFNSLEGPVPLSLTNVSYLDLSNNKLSGSISSWSPSTDGTLEYLNLSQNFLSGDLPDCWMHFNQLLVLTLESNRFSGAIPKSFGKLNFLKVLNLRNNTLSGEVPVHLKNCTSLRVLDLSENLLSGEVPSWIGDMFGLNVLILRHNKFFGNLPLEICHLSYIQVLDISLNNISGSIPSCLNNFTYLSGRANFSEAYHNLNAAQWTNFNVFVEVNSSGLLEFSIPDVNIHAFLVWKGSTQEYWKILALLGIIDLSSNRLTGAIPDEISLLTNLQQLNLSRNHLAGPIPPKLGQLKKLESLDLSRNQLFGEIPTSFLELDFLDVLDLSYNNLSGKIPPGTQLQGFDESSYMGNPLLCGPPLENKCSEDETPVSHHDGENVRDQDDNILSPGLYGKAAENMFCSSLQNLAQYIVSLG